MTSTTSSQGEAVRAEDGRLVPPRALDLAAVVLLPSGGWQDIDARPFG